MKSLVLSVSVVASLLYLSAACAQTELKPEWDFSGFVVLAQFAFDIGLEVANNDQFTTWNTGDEFRPARDKQVRK